MNKAVLVIDMPESCDKCPLFHGFYTDMTCGANKWGINYPYPKDFRQRWCPLKALPEEKSDDNVDGFFDGYDVGWNAYRKKILGE